MALLLWCFLESANLAGAHGLGAVLVAVGLVLWSTLFGHIVIAQTLLMGAAALISGRSPWHRRMAACLSGAALALQVGHDHAVAMGDMALTVSDMVHLLSAGAWLGCLLPLLLLVRSAPSRVGAAAARWFSPVGKVCVVGLVLSALFQGWSLVGDLSGLIGTPYGWVAGIKLMLLVVLLGFAVANRYELAPALLHSSRPEQARRVLVRSIGVQTWFGLLAVIAAAMLSSLQPSIHEQPVWPLTARPSLHALVDPAIRREVFFAVLTLAGAAAAFLFAVEWRRLRLVGLAVSCLAVFMALPHFSPLLVEAYPTSYFHSPTGFTALSIARGANLYAEHCMSCHGVDGRGDGPGAKGLAIQPADLTADHLWDQGDGELFWWLSHGIETPDGSLSMPGFRQQLSSEQRWDLIDYIRLHNAGVALRTRGRWPRPIRAPALNLVCGDQQSSTEALRGKVIHIVAVSDGPTPSIPASIANSAGVSIEIVLLLRGKRRVPRASACMNADPEAWDVYAALAGVAPSDTSGTQFLIDPQGWVRAEQRPGDTSPSWTDRSNLLAEARAICAHPVLSQAEPRHLH